MWVHIHSGLWLQLYSSACRKIPCIEVCSCDYVCVNAFECVGGCVTFLGIACVRMCVHVALNVEMCEVLVCVNFMKWYSDCSW